jgi:LytS/YehU family sensor histidine kinase
MKSNMTEPSLIKLSELLRYSLYESDQEKVLLDKEIEYLLNYIDLQKMRFGDDVSIELEITNNCSDFLIEPMLLISFIENAFKHGVGMLEHPFIQIRLNVNRESLLFTVVNNYNPLHLSKDKEGGIGLSNIRERLRLLYPQKHTLKIDDSKELFKVELYIELS